MKIITYPWEHSIVDNYYDQELFNNMQNELVAFTESFKIKMLKGNIDKDTIFKFCLIKNASGDPIWKCAYTNILKLFPHTTKCIESRYIQEDDLKHFSSHREYNGTLFLHTHISIIYNNNRRESNPIHYDMSSKVLTSVTFIAPEMSRGTILYDTNREYVTEAPWKQNSTLIFPPKDFVTWHAFETIENQYRIVVNRFLKRNIDEK